MKYLYLLISILVLNACIEAPNQYSQLPPGNWRAILKLSDPGLLSNTSKVEGDSKLKDYFELPFNFVVTYEGDELKVSLVNGEELIPIEGIYYGRDPRTAKDTLRLEFTAFDSALDGFYEENVIEGRWHVNYKNGYSIPFVAKYGLDHRFNTHNKEVDYDFSGKWDITFEYDTEDAYPAVGDFTQVENNLSGTIMTETGDYRYLAGNVWENKLRLSVFDGAHAFLFSASESRDTLYGEFRSGKHYKSNWIASRSSDKTLKDPYFMSVSTGIPVDDLNFPEAGGSQFSVNDERFSARVKLINIMGTWCPNCKDEINLLKEIQEKYTLDEISIVSLAFERYKNDAIALQKLQSYKKTMSFDWPLLLGGFANKSKNSEALDFIDHIYSYPTLLVLDQNNNIQHIHTGFYGPATSEYISFKEDFFDKLDKLLE